MTTLLWRKRRLFFLSLILVQVISRLSFLVGPAHLRQGSASSLQRVTTGVPAAIKNNSHTSRKNSNTPRHRVQQNRVFYNCTLPANLTIRNETITLDEEKMVTLPKVPDFIIIGSQKSGTTAIRSLLSLHPRFRNSTIKEPHFFDMHNSSLKLDNIHSIMSSTSPQNSLSPSEKRQRSLCEARYAYAQFFRLDDPNSTYSLTEQQNLIYYEKTPAYIITDRAAAKIRAVTPWAKIVVSLRNPIDRCFSQYQMEVERSGDEYSFEHWLARDLAVLRSTQIKSIVSLLPESNEHLPNITQVAADYGYFRPPHVDDTGEWKSANCIYRGMYAHQLQEQWLKYYTLHQDLLVVEFGRFQSKPREFLKQILDFVYPSGSHDNDNDIENDIAASSGDHDGQSSTNLQPQNVYHEEHFHTSYSPNPGEIRLVMSNITRDYLQRLFQPFNDQLADILGEEWRGIWD
jgi:Sulfotransferase domain